jgi:serine/threonine protein phosphatase 1
MIGTIRLKSFVGRRAYLPAAPRGARIYAIGDIHGRVDLLTQLFARIDADVALSPPTLEITEVYLGDYIDRGPASGEVLNRLIDRGRARRAVFLRGNHETYPYAFLQNPAFLIQWSQVGGLETLMSYGLRPAINAGQEECLEIAREFDQLLPMAHRHFLQNLRSSVSYGDYHFVHAGIRPGIPLAKQREEDLLGIRDEFLNCEDDFGKVIVHGHSPVSDPEFRPNRINIDTGAFATGRLTCLSITGAELRLI